MTVPRPAPPGSRTSRRPLSTLRPRALARGAPGLLGLGLLFLAFGAPRARAEEDHAPRLRAAMVRLHVTAQGYERTSPWRLYDERTRMERGVVIREGVILCKASTVEDQRMVEVSIANSARRYPARLLHADPGLGLALVAYDDPQLRAALAPIAFGPPVRLDEELELHQLGADNLPERYEARVLRAFTSARALQILVKTALSDSGDGQIAVRDGRLVGLVVSAWGSRQQATLYSVETLEAYLGAFSGDPAAGGTYRTAPGPGPWLQPMLRADLRKFHRMTDDHHGLAVQRVVAGRTGHGVLREGDVLLALDGYDLDDEGKFVHEVHGRLDSAWLWRGRRPAGETVAARVLREGQEVGVEFPLVALAPDEALVPERGDDRRPQYLVVGGLVLLELTADSPISRSPGGVILRRYRERAEWEPLEGRRRVVYADRLFKDEANKGYDWIQHVPVESVNGLRVTELADVPKALATPEGRFHVFRFEGVEADYVILAEERERLDRRIAATYKIPSLAYLHGQ